MSTEPFIGEIKLFAGNFAILGHAYCNGTLMSIAQNSALFSLIGTIYGGDGMTTFALPDLRGRIPIGMGSGAGLTARTIGQTGGSENVTLTINQIPAHNHSLNCNSAAANAVNPSGNFWAAQPHLVQFATTGSSAMKSNALSNSGGSQPHTNLHPTLTINYLIALEGLYPSRN